MTPSRIKRFFKFVPPLGAAAAFLAFVAPPATTQQGAADVNWRSYGSDPTNTRYSPLSQIDAGNFSQLQLAWTFSTANLGPVAILADWPGGVIPVLDGCSSLTGCAGWLRPTCRAGPGVPHLRLVKSRSADL